MQQNVEKSIRREEGRASFVKRCRDNTTEKTFKCREVGKGCSATSGFLQHQVTHRGVPCGMAEEEPHRSTKCAVAFPNVQRQCK